VGQKSQLEPEVVQEPAVGTPAGVVPTAAQHTAPPSASSPPIPPPVTAAGAPLAPPIVGGRPSLARTLSVTDENGVGALHGVGFSFRERLGGDGGGSASAYYIAVGAFVHVVLSVTV